MERAIREYLAFRYGMQEIFTYPWIEDEYIEASCADTGRMLCLKHTSLSRGEQASFNTCAGNDKGCIHQPQIFL